jgi:hypothetical protein
VFSLVCFLCTWVHFYALNNISITYIEKNSCVGMLIYFFPFLVGVVPPLAFSLHNSFCYRLFFFSYELLGCYVMC